MEFQLEEIRKEIARATDTASLRDLRDQIHEKLRSYPLDSFPGDWNDWVNTVHDELIRFAVSQAEKEMDDKGLGLPPKAYAMLLFGSGGRREQTLWSDQDNGLIYEDPALGEEEAVARYFEAFGQAIVDVLFQLGYPPCEGNVMCNNPLWRQSSSDWKATVDNWLGNPDWENIRYVLIIADSRCISGDAALGEVIRNHLLEAVKADKRLLGHMLRNTLRRKVSLGVLGNLIPERFGEDMGGIDIKYGAYIPFVNAIRLLAVRHGVPHSGTLERINGMEGKLGAEGEAVRDWRHAFGSVLKLRSLTSSKLEEGYYQSSGVLPGALLTKERKKDLKDALRTAQKLHKYVEKEMDSIEI
ncbi:MAG: hypothetical protein K0R57_1752 [Paenibacillaceae bacterium]|jgi:CBS domain-containing protein|nr:hypothetical protein [Paenibacillaceae bacterium]